MWFYIRLCFLFLQAYSYSEAYEQQNQVGDIGENGGTIISVVIEEELTDTLTELIGDFLETTEVWTYTETYIEEVNNITYETITTSTEVKTENLLGSSTDTNINVVGNNYGMTGAEITTGNETLGGGTRVYDIDLSNYDNKQKIDYGSKVYSHVSNQTVALCQNTSGDCKDDFKISVRLFEGGELKETYTHNYTGISWVGNQDFSFTQDVSQVNFNKAEVEYYGIDMGYPSGYFGVGFSDMFFDLTYNQINNIINEIINKIEYTVQLTTNEYLYSSEYVPPPPVDVIEIDFNNTEEPIVIDFNDFSEDLTVEIPVIEEIQEIEIFEIQEVELVEIEVQNEIEAEMQIEMEVDINAETEIEIEIEVESEPEPEVETTTDPEPEPEPETEVENEPEQEPEQEQEPKQEINSKELKQKIANKLMAKQKDKMSAQSQTTQLALMVILSEIKFDDLLATQITDTQFYEDLNFYQDQNLIIDYQAGILGYMDYTLINEMIDSQWK